MSKASKRRRFPWRPVLVYVAAVVVAGAALVAWDRAYQARMATPASTPPIRPELVAKRVVESFVGDGTVESATLDPKTQVLSMVVKDVVTDKAKTPAERREFLTAEGTQAVERVLGLVTFKQMVLQLKRDGKILATVRGEPGKKPQVDFAPDLK
jgi:hypothetical protein